MKCRIEKNSPKHGPPFRESVSLRSARGWSDRRYPNRTAMTRNDLNAGITGPDRTVENYQSTQRSCGSPVRKNLNRDTWIFQVTTAKSVHYRCDPSLSRRTRATRGSIPIFGTVATLSAQRSAITLRNLDGDRQGKTNRPRLGKEKSFLLVYAGIRW